MPRWGLSAFVVMIYCLRVYLINGWYIITYGLGIYVLNLLIGFLSPQADPESEGPVRRTLHAAPAPRPPRQRRTHMPARASAEKSTSLRTCLAPLRPQTLPTSRDDEFRPFIRRLPEFKFWYSFTKAFCVCFVMTFFSIFNIPVFWPILLLYFIALFVLTMKRQIKHMIKCARAHTHLMIAARRACSARAWRRRQRLCAPRAHVRPAPLDTRAANRRPRSRRPVPTQVQVRALLAREDTVQGSGGRRCAAGEEVGRVSERAVMRRVQTRRSRMARRRSCAWGTARAELPRGEVASCRRTGRCRPLAGGVGGAQTLAAQRKCRPCLAARRGPLTWAARPHTHTGRRVDRLWNIDRSCGNLL